MTRSTPTHATSLPATTQDVDATVAEHQQNGLLRVVVVDDDESIRRLLQVVLGHSEGVEVVGSAENGAQAVELVASEAPDAVLLDLMLADEFGTDLIAPILERRPQTMVALLSALSAEREEAAGLAAGAFVYYEKPMINQLADYLAADVALHRRRLAGEDVAAPRAAERR